MMLLRKTIVFHSIESTIHFLRVVTTVMMLWNWCCPSQCQCCSRESSPLSAITYIVRILPLINHVAKYNTRQCISVSDVSTKHILYRYKLFDCVEAKVAKLDSFVWRDNCCPWLCVSQRWINSARCYRV